MQVLSFDLINMPNSHCWMLCGTFVFCSYTFYFPGVIFVVDCNSDCMGQCGWIKSVSYICWLYSGLITLRKESPWSWGSQPSLLTSVESICFQSIRDLFFDFLKKQFVECLSTWEGKQVSYLNTYKTFPWECVYLYVTKNWKRKISNKPGQKTQLEKTQV